MELKNFNVYFFIAALAGISVLTYFIFQPFLIAILMAAILAVIFQRPYLLFLKISGNRKRVSAFFTSLFGILIFIGLFLIIVGLFANELANMYKNFALEGDVYEKYVNPLSNKINENNILKSLGVNTFISEESITDSFKQLGQGSLALFQKTYQGIAHFIFLAVVMFFTMYYFLIGGKSLVKRIMYLSPLKDSHEKILIKKFISISRATVKGTLVIGFVQGAIGGLTFFIVGVPSAIVWGILMMFLSLIPMIGSSLIWFPAGIIMLLIGNIWQGVTILIVGFAIISLIDNFLRPELVGKDTQMHPLMIFFSTLGGLAIFGPLGFIFGPMIVALFVSLWEIYGVEFKGQLKKYNA